MIKFDLSELPIAPSQYRLGGFILLGSGLLLFIIGLCLAFNTQSDTTNRANRLKMATDTCTAHATKLGLKSLADGDKIHINETDMSQTVQLLASSSQVISLCPGWELSQYCLGSGCKPAGLGMVLQYQETKK